MLNIDNSIATIMSYILKIVPMIGQSCHISLSRDLFRDDLEGQWKFRYDSVSLSVPELILWMQNQIVV